MPLETEGWLVGEFQTLQTAVEQADVRGPHVGGECFFIHGETVVLAGDGNTSGGQVFDRMVGTVVTKFHLVGLCAAGQGQNLMAQTNTEGRNALLDDLFCGANGVIARTGIARPVGEKHPIGFHGQNFCSCGFGWHHS